MLEERKKNIPLGKLEDKSTIAYKEEFRRKRAVNAVTILEISKAHLLRPSPLML